MKLSTRLGVFKDMVSFHPDNSVDYPHFNCDKIGSEGLAEPGLEHRCLPLTTILHITYMPIFLSRITMNLYSVLKYPMDNWGKGAEGGGVKAWREIRSYWGGDGSRVDKQRD